MCYNVFSVTTGDFIRSFNSRLEAEAWAEWHEVEYLDEFVVRDKVETDVFYSMKFSENVGV